MGLKDSVPFFCLSLCQNLSHLCAQGYGRESEAKRMCCLGRRRQLSMSCTFATLPHVLDSSPGKLKISRMFASLLSSNSAERSTAQCDSLCANTVNCHGHCWADKVLGVKGLCARHNIIFFFNDGVLTVLEKFRKH